MVSKHDRRQFLAWAGASGLALLAAAGGVSVLSGCRGQSEAEDLGARPHQAISAAQAVADPCHDLSKLSAGDLATRKTFKYVKRSTDPERYCQACDFWRPDRPGGPCGSCSIVKGPIHPLGHCRSWLERTNS